MNTTFQLLASHLLFSFSQKYAVRIHMTFPLAENLKFFFQQRKKERKGEVLKSQHITLARWRVWLERCPVHQSVAASMIPSQGTYLGFGFHLQSACERETNQSMFLSPSLSLSLPTPSFSLFLKSVNVSLRED